MSMDSDHSILADLERASSLDDVTRVYQYWLNWGNDDEVGWEIKSKIAKLKAEEMKPELERQQQQEAAEWQSICQKIAARRAQFTPSQFQPGHAVRCLMTDCQFTGKVGIVEAAINNLCVTVRFEQGCLNTSDQKLERVRPE